MDIRYGRKPGRTDRSLEKRRIRSLMMIGAVILFIGLFLQITMLARLSAQNKAVSSMEREIAKLDETACNLELSINQHHNLTDIATRAAALGMEQPDITQTRVVSVVMNQESTSTQTVANVDGSESLN